MFGNFFKVAFRMFIRNRVHTLINIFGLAVGISFSIIIFLYAHKEISYDRFHENARRIYRIAIKGRIAENTVNYALTSTPLAGTMKREIPEVEDAVRVARFGAWLLRYDTLRYNEDNIIFSDPGFFTMFSFPLIKGEADKVLSKPYSIVLSETIARKYFGNANPYGKKLRIENDSTYYTVTGVMKDVPENSHIHFDMVGTMSTYEKMLENDRWVINYLYTYFMLREGSSLQPVKDGLRKIVNRYVFPDYKKLLNLEGQSSFTASTYYNFIPQPLTDIHLESKYYAEFEPAGKFLYVYLFIILAFIILILSCMNFVSLVTAQSFKRAMEVGIRKVSGSERHTLINQFLVESLLLAFLAMLLALFFTEIALPSISRFIGLRLSLGQLLNSEGFILLITLIIIIGLIAGFYPAWYLSSYDPGSVLKIKNQPEDIPEKGRFRTGLTIFQMFLAVGALSMTMIIFMQYRFLVNKDRGYDTNDLVVIRRPDALTKNLEAFKEQVKKNHEVLAIANATSAMGGGFPRFPFHLENTSTSQNHSMSTLFISHGFDSTYRITMTSGRFFDRSLYSDSNSCVVNETAIRQMGITNPLGKNLIQLATKEGSKSKYKIIGVVKDFYFETLENPIRPLILLLMPGNLEGYLTVRLSPENQDTTLNFIKEVWEQYTDAYPFVYYYLDKDRQEYYKPVLTTARIFVLLSVITIIMACLSLFAMVSFIYNQKLREIGIQKTMGATNLNIAIRRGGIILAMILSASVFAWIGVYFLAKGWLNDYAYHINMNIIYFLAATLIMIIPAMGAVYYHTFLTMKANPGFLLKYE